MMEIFLDHAGQRTGSALSTVNLMAAIGTGRTDWLFSQQQQPGSQYKRSRNGHYWNLQELVYSPAFCSGLWGLDSQWGKVYVLRVLHAAEGNIEAVWNQL